jgi:hypothetical protein
MTRFGKLKTILFLVLVLAVFLVIPTTCGAAGITTMTTPDVTVKVNGQVVMDGVALVVENNRILIPLRDILDGLGVKISWLPDIREAIISGSHIISLKPGNSTAVVDGKDVAMDAPAMIVDGRIMAPVRFLSENLGAKVIWVEDTNTIEIIDLSKLTPDQTQLLQAFENQDAMTGADMKRVETTDTEPGATEGQPGNDQTETDVKFDINGNDFHAWLTMSTPGDDSGSSSPDTLELIKKEGLVYAKSSDDDTWEQVDSQYLDTVLYPLSWDTTPDEDFLDYYLLPFKVDDNASVNGQTCTQFTFDLSQSFTADQESAPGDDMSNGDGADQNGAGTIEQATDDMYIDSLNRIVKQDLTLVTSDAQADSTSTSGPGTTTDTFTLDMNCYYTGTPPVITTPGGVFPEA